MTPTRTLAVAAATAALALAPLAPATAQEAETPQSESAVPDALLDSFVMAALSVSEVAEDYQGRIQAAENDEARQQLATEARQAMITAVEDTDGITVEEYVTIAEAAQTDEALNQRVMDVLAERSGAE